MFNDIALDDNTTSVPARDVRVIQCHSDKTDTFDEYQHGWTFPNGSKVMETDAMAIATREEGHLALTRLGNTFLPGGEYCCKAQDARGTSHTLCVHVEQSRSVLFQLRLTNINHCPDWVVSAIIITVCRCINPILQEQPYRVTAVTEALVSEIQGHCQCSFAPSDIQEPSFQCFPESNQAVTFHAITTSSFIDGISRWIVDDGLLRVQMVIIRVDNSCQVEISSLADTECTNQPVSNDVAAVIGGVIGVVIVLIIVVGITVIVIAHLVFKSRREKLTINKTTK